MRILLSLCVVLSGSSLAQAESLIDVGKPFPLARLPLVSDEKKAQTIEPYRGRKLMLHLFASW